MARNIFAVINIMAGIYAAYWGWTRGGIYLLTVFFIGCVMSIFGLTLLFIKPKKKKKLEYKNVYTKEE